MCIIYIKYQASLGYFIAFIVDFNKDNVTETFYLSKYSAWFSV